MIKLSLDTVTQRERFGDTIKIHYLIPALFTLWFTTACSDRLKTHAAPMELNTTKTQTITDDFSHRDNTWHSYDGTWLWQDGQLIQTATDHCFPLILREKERFATLDLSVRFKPISGQIDASGGLVFRAQDKENYYIVRANALEGNYRLYTFKNGYRSQIASATITPPALGQWHTLRVTAQGDHIQAWLDGTLYLDHHDDSFASGYVGLWTKADSVTAFDGFKVAGE